jgi:hypothetical protein
MEEIMTYAIDETLVAKARELGPLIREHAPRQNENGAYRRR